MSSNAKSIEPAHRAPDVIGGSEIAAIMGEHPYLSPYDLAAIKKGLMERPTNMQMFRGKKMEKVVAEMWAEQEGKEIRWLDQTVVGEEPWIVVTPDFELTKEPTGGEVKTVGIYTVDRWGEPGTDQAPVEYILQAQWAMMVLKGWQRVNIAPFFHRDDIRTYPVEPDLELQGILREAASKFRKDYLLTDKLPPITKVTALTEEYVRKLAPRDVAPARSATPAELEVVKEFRDVLELYEGLDEQRELLKTQLKAAIGPAAGLFGEGFRISYKAARDSTKVDWEAIARYVLPGYTEHLAGKVGNTDALLTVEGILKSYTEIRPGSRRFLPTFTGGREAS